MFARFAAVLAVFLIAAGPALASVDTAVMNKEGYWSIDVDGASCAASMTLQGGSIFLLRGHEGDVAVALFSPAVLPKGKTLSLEVDGRSVDLRAKFIEEGTTVYLDGALDAPTLASLRGGRRMRVLIDGRAVAAMTLEGTGFPDALDSLVACSRGQSGWWGEGVQPEGPAPAGRLAFNAEDVWTLLPLEKSGACVAQAGLEEKQDRYLQFFEHEGGMTIAVLSHGPRLHRGRKGVLSLDGGDFDFTPLYPDATLMVMSGSVTGDALLALRATKGMSLRIDGKVLLEVGLEGTGFPRILDELAACARGETGWWTANAAASTVP
jgi:hypothetical protein